MSETPKKAPARKRAASTPRKPSRAAAIKALGITEEEIALIKNKIAKSAEGAVQNLPTETATSIAVSEDKTETFYARNLHHIPVGFRINGKRIDLKPRGERGDLVKITPEQLQDDSIINQVQITVELVPEQAARDIISKQSHNIQRQPHPTFALLRNEIGEEYSEDAVRTQPVAGSEDIVVASLEPVGGGAGNLASTRGTPGVDWQKIKNPAPAGEGSTFISDGFQQAAEGPAAGFDGPVRLVVEPTQVQQ